MSKRALESASVIETDGGSPPDADRLRSRLWLEFLFAFLTAAGGVVLGSGQMASEGTETIAAIAVFTAIVGFLFVDWLKFFELPPLGAYLAMGGAAAYCVREFWSQSETGRPQMLSVALLLVLVQGTLMLQRKSRRILEQLAVFCLLELVVAAIFNDAIAFGLMLFPVAVLGGIALSLLTIVTALEDVEVAIEESEVVEPRSRLRRFFDFLASRTYDSDSQRSYVRTASPDSIAQGNAAAGAWTKYAMLSLLPAVLLIAGAFFYVLPRRVEASRAVGSGNAMVGFDDRIRLDQLGRLSQNSMIALKVELTNARTGKPYRARGSLYLRGKTLETYEVDFQDSRPTATWVAQPPEAMNKSSLLPDRARISDSEFAARLDDVNVRITCETMNRPSLFSIAPYHRIGVEDSNEDALMHVVNRWTLQRRDKEPPHPRIEYSFGTAAFADKKQTPLIGDPPFKRLSDTSSILDLTPQLREQQLQNRRYLRAVLQCDRKRIPTIVRKAEEITDSIPDANRTRASVALAMERYLANDADFQYTLNLNSTPIPNLDPIEQFMAVDRRGHCQYFASSLALMLRSVGIPSRVVVGYRTEEYNPIGKYHIARQSHAHAWVEALIEAGELPPAIVPAGQSLAKRYWMRLDPTPSASAEDDGNAAGVSGLINLANHLWDDYVVEMDQKKQTEGLGRATQLDAVQDSYEGFFTRLKNRMKSTFGTETSAGSFRLDRDAIVLFVLLFMAMLLTMWFGSRLVGISFGPEANAGTETIAAAIPQLDFYRTMLEQLERLGIERQYHETPYEFLSRIDADLPAIDSLTRTFVQHRYGASESDETDVRSQSELSLLTMEVERRLRQRTFSS